MFFFYHLLYSAALLFHLPFEYFRRPRALRKRWLKERFGFFDPLPAAQDSPTVWVHAVSVGEVIAAVPLIGELNSRYPNLKIVVSTVTDTGQKVACERIGDRVSVIYAPFDLPFAVKKAITNVGPSLFIIMETELWPTMIKKLGAGGVPVLLMNGRISEKSFAGYRKVRFFLRYVLADVSFFCMQSDVYAARIRSLGANPERVAVIGSFKFDTKPSAPAPEWTKLLEGPVIVAGSTHRTEEDLIIDVYGRLRTDFPEANLVIAPRHPERFREVEELVRKRGLEYLKRSELTDRGTEVRATGCVVILDAMGELARVYGACDIAVMGGSFIEHGGQNPLEPAFWGKAILCGPHMENFPFIDDFYRSGGALGVDEESLYATVRGLLNSPQERASMGRIARELYEKNAGATARAMEVIERYLGKR